MEFEKEVRPVLNNFKTIQNSSKMSESLVKKFHEEFSIVFAYNSNAIEGNTFTLDETMMLLKHGVVDSVHSIREQNEIIGHDKAYWFVYDSIKKDKTISNELIKDIHKRVAFDQDFAGEYRNVDVVVGNTLTSRIDFRPLSSSMVIDAMDDYVERLNNDLKQFKETIDFEKLFHILADHHSRFERIHPFQDGNGRVGRLLLMYELLTLGLLPVDIRFSDIKRYYAALKAYDQKAKYSKNKDSKTEALASLLLESELRSQDWWIRMFHAYIND